MLKLIAEIFVEPNDPEGDPDDIVSSFNGGMGESLAGFPEGQVTYAKVVHGAHATKEELEERGLVE